MRVGCGWCGVHGCSEPRAGWPSFPSGGVLGTARTAFTAPMNTTPTAPDPHPTMSAFSGPSWGVLGRVVLVPLVAFLGWIGWSYLRALTAPGNDAAVIRTTEWLKNHHFTWAINDV